MGKMIGMLTAFMYIMDGSNKTMQSMWNGPPGQLVKALGKCFHPNTKIKLKNGKIVCMKDIHLGDILENGSRVNAVMKIDNQDKEDLYKISSKGTNGEDIFVTGSHLIYDKRQCKYIEVKHYSSAVKQTEVKTEWFSCLITDDHFIQIGEELFWDWEDYIHKL